MQELITELGNYQNAMIVAVTWAIVQAMGPVFNAGVMLPRFVAYRLTLYALAKYGKIAASCAWCSFLVWMPYAQPPLCEAGPADGCQTEFARVSLGLILGALLSSGHWGVSKAWRKFSGKSKSHKIACASCATKYVTDDWAKPCPKCGKPPHEVTRS